jgi:hypothetical protein
MGWQNTNESLRGLADYLTQQQQKKQEMQQALQMLFLKAQIESQQQRGQAEWEAQLKQQYDPEAQFRQQMLNMFAGNGQPQGQMPAGQGAMPQGNMMGGGFRPKSLSYGGFTFERQPSEEETQQGLKLEAQKDIQKQEIQTQGAMGKQSAEAQRNFDIARNKLKTTAGAFKAMAQQAGGMGRGAGFAGIWTGATGQNPYIKAFEGQLVEAAAALAKLAAPSARVGQEIIQQFRKTLPTKFSNYGEFINQIRFSLHNAYSTALAGTGQEYTPEIKAKVDSMVEDIINTPPMSLNDLQKLNIPINAQQQKKSGRTLDKNTAIKFLNQAKGNRDLARQLAQQAGYSF